MSTTGGHSPRAVLISTKGIFPVYLLKPWVNLYILLVGECSAFLASGSDPTMLCTICLLRTWDDTVKFLPPA